MTIVKTVSSSVMQRLKYSSPVSRLREHPTSALLPPKNTGDYGSMRGLRSAGAALCVLVEVSSLCQGATVGNELRRFADHPRPAADARAMLSSSQRSNRHYSLSSLQDINADFQLTFWRNYLRASIRLIPQTKGVPLSDYCYRW